MLPLSMRRRPSSIIFKPLLLRYRFSNPSNVTWSLNGMRERKFVQNGPHHMTKMATLPIYGKKSLKILFIATEMSMTLKVAMLHQVLEYYHVCSNDPGLTLTYFTARSNLVPYAFVWVKMDFSEIIVVCDIKVGRCC